MLYETAPDAIAIDRGLPFAWPDRPDRPDRTRRIERTDPAGHPDPREPAAHSPTGIAEPAGTILTGEPDHGAEPHAAEPHGAEPGVVPGTDAVPEAPLEMASAIAAPSGDSLDDAVKMWLRQAGRTPLLSFGEEILLARRIESGARAASILREGRPEATDHQRTILQRVAEQGQRSRERLIGANLRLVVAVARRYLGRGLTFGDLVQEGNIGLLRAVEKYDHRRGYKFSTYATWWIRQSISRALADQGRTIRVPVHMMEAMNRVMRAQSRLAQSLGREPTLEEVASEMGVSVDRVREAVDVIAEPLSLETPIGEENARLCDFLEDTTSLSPMETLSQTTVRDQLDALLRDVLTERERQVVALRFGLEDGEPRTLDEVGAVVGVTRERIRQLEIRAMRKLRQPGRAGRLRELLAER